MTESDRKILNEVADQFADREYEFFSALQYMPYIEERTDAAGFKLTIRAEARDEDGSLVIPIELWRGRDVWWIHLFVNRHGKVRIDRHVCTNPSGSP
jgi:hypothetical protein